jgi:hypothetical protein
MTGELFPTTGSIALLLLLDLLNGATFLLLSSSFRGSRFRQSQPFALTALALLLLRDLLAATLCLQPPTLIDLPPDRGQVLGILALLALSLTS